MIIRDLIIYYRIGNRRTYQMMYHLRDEKPIDKVKIRQAARLIAPILSQRYHGQEVTIQKITLRTQETRVLK